MNNKEIKRRGPLKRRIFLWLALFTAVIVLLMWAMQSIFLERIYKSIKVREIRSAADRLVDKIDSADLGEEVDETASDSVCVTIVNMDGYGRPVVLFSNHAFEGCVIHAIDTESVFSLYNGAKENGGSQLQRFMYDSSTRRYIGLTGGFFDKSEDRSGDFPESIIYSVVTTDAAGDEIFIMLNTTISPVGGTVRTLNLMLGVVTVVLIGLAAVMAVIISRRISRPIARLTGSARELARGNYDVAFEGGGYREADELADALNYAENELAKTDTLRRELVANVSHDLRTPLTMMIGYSEMMRDIPGENTPENVQVVIDESRRLSALVNDLLDYSKLESGVGSNDPEPFDLTDAVQSTLDRFAKMCEKDGRSIEFFCGDHVRVNADEARITQAVFNLVSNALAHVGEDKRVTVTQEVDAEGGAVRISVADSGEGIPAEKLPLIWDRYYKVDSHHSRASTGSGLGLAIVKKIMEQNGGSCGVASSLGEGSVFWIELPTID